MANEQDFLDKKIQEVASSSALNKYYIFANDLINNLLDKKKRASHDTECVFGCIYGATLSGCVQKKLAIPNVSCGYLVFLHHLKKKDLIGRNTDLLQQKHKNILEWIEQCIEKMKKQGTHTIVRRHSESSLRIKWKGVEYHIVIACTFSKRQYCEFHYTQQNVHVYPFSSEQLQMAANDLIDEAPIHQRYIKQMSRANKAWTKFLEKNMSASLSLLRVYYMREELVGKNTRSAIMFLKMWQHYQVKDKKHLSNNSLEIICVHLFDQLKNKSQPNLTIFSFDIIEEFFKFVAQFKKPISEVLSVEWPYQDKYLLHSEDVKNFKRTLNPGSI
ncbi:hypothetical protein RFI_16732, partial [Reticulomyxa filosa]